MCREIRFQTKEDPLNYFLYFTPFNVQPTQAELFGVEDAYCNRTHNCLIFMVMITHFRGNAA